MKKIIIPFLALLYTTGLLAEEIPDFVMKHDSDFLHEDGVNYYISQGLGWVDPKEMLPD